METPKMVWDGDVLRADTSAFESAEVRTRCEGLEYDYKITRLGRPSIVSEPYRHKDDAWKDLEAEVRQILKKAMP